MQKGVHTLAIVETKCVAPHINRQSRLCHQRKLDRTGKRSPSSLLVAGKASGAAVGFDNIGPAFGGNDVGRLLNDDDVEVIVLPPDESEYFESECELSDRGISRDKSEGKLPLRCI